MHGRFSFMINGTIMFTLHIEIQDSVTHGTVAHFITIQQGSVNVKCEHGEVKRACNIWSLSVIPDICKVPSSNVSRAELVRICSNLKSVLCSYTFQRPWKVCTVPKTVVPTKKGIELTKKAHAVAARGVCRIPMNSVDCFGLSHEYNIYYKTLIYIYILTIVV